MGGRVMFSVIIGKVVRPRPPIDQELPLAGPVLDPIKAHVDCLGSFLVDRVICEIFGIVVVDLHRRWRLRVAHLLESGSNGNGFLSVEVRGGSFGFGSGSLDVADDARE